jgi:hypothetical protein
MVALGKSRAVLWQSVRQFCATAAFVYAGAQFGIVEVMIAYVGVAIFVGIFNSLTLTKELNLDGLALLKTLLPPLISCAIMVTVLVFTRIEISEMMPLLRLAILVVVGSVTYGACLLAGDFSGLWRSYVRNAARSLLDASAARKPA